MTMSIAVVCEGSTDLITGGHLADRVILDKIGEDSGGWIADHQLDMYRKYRGLYLNDEFLPWKVIEKLAKEKVAKPVLGLFKGYFPSHEDEWDILRAFQLLLFHSPQPPDGIIFLRDTDDEEERWNGLKAARQTISHGAKNPAPVVIGIAHTKRECWHIVGFEPWDEAEKARVDAVHQELGFDPRMKSDELRGSGTQKHKSAKRILSRLTGDDLDRETACLRETSLSILRERGQLNGLTDYLDDLEKHLLPVFGYSGS